ncbi:hypothetical protein HKW98_00985 [Stutzerimonas urumqiensis]|uniref:hypothetical protein n=1 Tax=Stutzerimonas urumqiensis TaxID=638269 RepID=UPI003BA942D4
MRLLLLLSLASLPMIAPAQPVFSCIDVDGEPFYSSVPCHLASKDTRLDLYRGEPDPTDAPPPGPDEPPLPDNQPPPGVVIEFGDPSGTLRNPDGR